jgi:hypothetical protein
MDFGSVLRGSWNIIWKNKVLWIFGILASCSGGGANFGGGVNYQMSPQYTNNLPLQFQQWARDFEAFINEGGLAIILAFVCAAILLGLILWVVGIFGKVGLIKGILRADDGLVVSFGSLARESWGMLGSALGLNLVLILIPLAGFILLAIVAIPVGIFTLGIGLICLICLMVPVAFGYGVYTQLANVALVREQRGVSAALSSAWELFRTKLGPLAAMAVILILGGLVIGFLLLLPVAAVALPAFLAFRSDPEAFGRGLLTSGILLLIALPFIIVANGIIQSYLHSAWTLTYLQLTPSAPPKPTRAKAKTN